MLDFSLSTQTKIIAYKAGFSSLLYVEIYYFSGEK
jgi:hypothetical protein